MHSIASGYRLPWRLAIGICTLSLIALGQWTPAESTATNAGLRGVHNAGNGIIWASGNGGTVLRSEDDGFVWQRCALPEDAHKLDFRGVWAWDANHAIVMSSGPGDGSRLYETLDGGASWRLLFKNPDPTGFWDGITFSGKKGMLVGDPVDGRFTVFHSEDLGQHWIRDQSQQLAADPKRDGIFAASNSSLAPRAFVTGGLNGPKLFSFLTARVSSLGRAGGEIVAWASTVLPLASGSESAGAFSIAGNPNGQEVVVGGDYRKPEERSGTAAYGVYGTHWEAASVPPSGFRSAVAWEPNLQCWITVGPNGSDVSFDGGKSWQPLDKGNWNALSLPWVVGARGHIARLDEHAVKALAGKK